MTSTLFQLLSHRDIMSMMPLASQLTRPTYRRLKVHSVSLDAMDYGYEPAVSDTFTDLLSSSTDLYKALTKRQRKIARQLARGYSRKEVAAKNGISVQAIHQMVPRMRSRLRAYLTNRHDL